MVHKNLILFLIASILPLNILSQSKETELKHPFLIVREDQYDALRKKSAYEPWKSIEADALRISENTEFGSVFSNRSNEDRAYLLQDFVGAAALCYILDEENAHIHAQRVKDAIINHYAQLNPNENSDWTGVVPNMGSFFVAILSLDIVYNALSMEDLQACEEIIETQISKIKRTGSWSGVRLGTHGCWDIYKGVRTTPDDEYYDRIMQQITEDGVSSVTIHYAWERLGGGDSRVAKSGYMDVLEFTGIDNRYYNNERIKQFYRWLFGSSVNCAKEMELIGDMTPYMTLHNDMLNRRIVNFDMEAAAYVSWFYEGIPAKGNILTYILPKAPLPKPLVPSSKSYTNGGAFFREKEDNPDGLHAVLYNIKSQDEWHTHNEVNGLALSGMGNRLLINGGRLGSPARPAYLNNTLTINGENHVARVGGGIVEHIIADKFDYACGFSGPALDNASHYRNLILVHGSEITDAYFLLIDEVKTDKTNQIKNYIHLLNQSAVETISNEMVYTADIDYFPTIENTQLTCFFVSPADTLNIDMIPSNAGRYSDHPGHNRFEAVYNSIGQNYITTVLYPHQKGDISLSFERTEHQEYSGGILKQNAAIKDYIFTSKSDKTEKIEGVEFKARILFFRKENEHINQLFAKDASQLKWETNAIKSNRNLSLYLSENSGVLVLKEKSKLTFSGEIARSISIGETGTEMAKKNQVIIELPMGNHTFSW
ncbi:MAG: hypothetical protein K9H49_12495 [Bacteroidales bacterium]|nr:hypothetical protein [Bacteroidales bacterium]MCF8390616.1 hypothetical protein [Bacteroidales bacterium]